MIHCATVQCIRLSPYVLRRPTKCTVYCRISSISDICNCDLFGYLVGGYEFVLQVQICTPYAGGFGMAIPNQ
jgi:hypothetical protein